MARCAPVRVYRSKVRIVASDGSPHAGPAATPNEATSIVLGRRITIDRGPVTWLPAVEDGASLPHPNPSERSIAPAGPQPYWL